MEPLHRDASGGAQGASTQRGDSDEHDGAGAGADMDDIAGLRDGAASDRSTEQLPHPPGNAIAVVLLEVASCDFWALVPALRRITGLSHLERIGTGLTLSVYAALLELVRLDMAPVRLSVFWQLPLLVAMESAMLRKPAHFYQYKQFINPDDLSLDN